MPTTDTTKPLDLDAIRKRTDAATKGPWDLVTDSCDCGDGYGCPHGEFPFALHLPEHTVSDAERPCDPDDSLDSYRHHASDISELTMETAEFIAAAREDVPALLAEIDQLRAELAKEDRAHIKTIEERDRYHEAADNLAHAIAAMTGVEIGEHSSMNDPWQNALDVAEGWTRAGAR